MIVEYFVAMVFIIGAYAIGADQRQAPKQMTAQDCAIMCVDGPMRFDELRKICECQKSRIDQ